jgi:hypothetical protein
LKHHSYNAAHKQAGIAMTVDDRIDRMEKIVEKLVDAQLGTQSQLGLMASVVGQMRIDLASIKSEQQEQFHTIEPETLG